MEKKENRSKKQKRNFAGTEKKIKDIMPTNTHGTKLILQESIQVVYINLKTINPRQMSNLISYCRAVSNFNDYKEENGISHHSNNNLYMVNRNDFRGFNNLSYTIQFF